MPMSPVNENPVEPGQVFRLRDSQITGWDYAKARGPPVKCNT